MAGICRRCNKIRKSAILWYLLEYNKPLINVHEVSAAKGCPDKWLGIPVYSEGNELPSLCLVNYKTAGMKRNGPRIWDIYPAIEFGFKN